MHPILLTIETQLENFSEKLKYQFSLQCVSEVSSNLEDEAAIGAFEKFKSLISNFDSSTPNELKNLSDELKGLAQSHQGSKSIDGTRHAAVSATYALSKAVEGNAAQAAAYAAYSSIYGYGGYAVNDPDSFSEVHQRQLEILEKLKLQHSEA